MGVGGNKSVAVASDIPLHSVLGVSFTGHGRDLLAIYAFSQASLLSYLRLLFTAFANFMNIKLAVWSRDTAKGESNCKLGATELLLSLNLSRRLEDWNRCTQDVIHEGGSLLNLSHCNAGLKL